MSVTKSTDWDCKSDPRQDLIDAYEWYLKNSDGEKDLWVSKKEKDFLNNTIQGQRIMARVISIVGHPIKLRSPDEIGAVQFESEMIMNEESLFNPLPTYKRLVGGF